MIIHFLRRGSYILRYFSSSHVQSCKKVLKKGIVPSTAPPLLPIRDIFRALWKNRNNINA